MLQRLRADEPREEIIPPHALAQDIGAREHAIGRHDVGRVREGGRLLGSGGGAQAVQQEVHAYAVEFLGGEGEGFEAVADDGAGGGVTGAGFGGFERARLVVEEGHFAVGGGRGFGEVVAGADADVEVVAADVGEEEGEEVGGYAAAPGEGGDDAEDPDVVDEEAEGGVDGFLEGGVVGVGGLGFAGGDGTIDVGVVRRVGGEGGG